MQAKEQTGGRFLTRYFWWPVFTVELVSPTDKALEKLIQTELDEYRGLHSIPKPKAIFPEVDYPLIATKKRALYAADASPTGIYFPFEANELLLRAVQVDLEDEEQILRFVQEFGFPSNFGQTQLSVESEDGDYQSKPLHPDRYYAFETLFSIRASLARIQVAVHEFFALEQPAPTLDRLIALPTGESAKSSHIKNVVVSLEDGLKNVRFGLSSFGDELFLGFTAKCLRDVLTYRALMVMAEQEPLRQCADYKCRAFFIPKRSDNIYHTKECGKRAKTRTAYREDTLNQRLLRFVDKRGGTWQDKYSAWNTEYPDTPFTSVKEMKELYKKAKQV